MTPEIDVSNFSSIVRDHVRNIIRRRKLPAMIDQDDLFQAGMEGVIRACKGVRPGYGGSLDGFYDIHISGSIRHEIRDAWHGRRFNIRPILVGLEDEDEEIRDLTAPDLSPYEQVVIDEIKSLVSDLPEREFLVITLRYYDRFTFQDIGEVLGVSERMIRKIHDSAADRMRRINGDP